MNWLIEVLVILIAEVGDAIGMVPITPPDYPPPERPAIVEPADPDGRPADAP